MYDFFALTRNTLRGTQEERGEGCITPTQSTKEGKGGRNKFEVAVKKKKNAFTGAIGRRRLPGPREAEEQGEVRRSWQTERLRLRVQP